jgi:hypothetical protein
VLIVEVEEVLQVKFSVIHCLEKSLRYIDKAELKRFGVSEERRSMLQWVRVESNLF